MAGAGSRWTRRASPSTLAPSSRAPGMSMPFMIETFDKPGTLALRAATRPAHLAFLAAHARLLIACGGKLDDDGEPLGGGLYIVALESRAEAEAFLAADPLAQAGLFARVEITRWREGYVDGVCRLPAAG